jgi:alpha-tubulin suppressor-like RCC1 family protein
MALLDDGSVRCWGNNDGGQLNVPAFPAGRRVTQISAGTNHSMALLDDGSVTCWGDNAYGQLTVPAFPAGRRVTQISAGGLHSLALLDDGSVRCWGLNRYGQLNVPAFPAGTRVTQISTGKYYSMALLDDGSVRCWGDNTYRQLTVPNFNAPDAAPVAAPAPTTPLVQDTPAYREALASRLTCPICYERERNTVLNCGHLFCAEDTTVIRAAPNPKCPLCQTPITSAQKIFYGGYRQKYLKYKAKYLELKNSL